MMCLIIYASYLVSRYVASNSVSMGISKYMKIVDRIPLGKDRYILIVTINQKAFLLGVTDEGVTQLSPLEISDLVEQEKLLSPAENSLKSFKQIFKNKLKPDDSIDSE